MAAELTCPKCHGAMRTYERNTITVDQCVDCRGIFLDRGELDQLLDAETAYNQTAQPTPPSPSNPQGSYGYESGHHGSARGQGGHNKRRKGFLGELFD